jgi:hypothetical protein
MHPRRPGWWLLLRRPKVGSLLLMDPSNRSGRLVACVSEVATQARGMEVDALVVSAYTRQFSLLCTLS